MKPQMRVQGKLGDFMGWNTRRKGGQKRGGRCLLQDRPQGEQDGCGACSDLRDGKRGESGEKEACRHNLLREAELYRGSQ